MTFDQWMKRRAPGHRKTDDSLLVRGMRECWEAGYNEATKNEREACAHLCDKHHDAARPGDAAAAIFDCAVSIRARSNVGGKGRGAGLPAERPA